MRFDVFLSYASRDRTAIVEPFLKTLQERGIKSWCDVHEINWGDSIIEKIQQGLAASRFVIAFISDSYLERDWPMKELRTAMAEQISGRTRVLPVLLGVQPESLADTLPFLSEVRHISIADYNESVPVSDYHIHWLVRELEIVQGQGQPFDVSESVALLDMGEEVLSVSFNRNYSFFSVLTASEYCETRWRRQDVERSNIRQALGTFIQKSGLSESEDFCLCWLDIDRSASPMYVLASGNVIRPHRAAALSGEIEMDDYIQTEAPPRPCCVTEGTRGEIILGYPDGRIFIRAWEGRQMTLEGRSSAVTSLDTSAESILASGDEAGCLSIWSRRTGARLNMVAVGGGPISSIAVSRRANVALIAVGNSSGRISLYNFEGKEQARFGEIGGPVINLQFIPGAKSLLASASGCALRIWEYSEAREALTLYEHDSDVTSLHVASGPKWDFEMLSRERTREQIVVITAGFCDGRVQTWRLTC